MQNLHLTQQKVTTNYEIRTMNYELAGNLIYPAQSNKMLKYKNVKFLQLFAKKCALLITFVKFPIHFCTFLHPFSTFLSCPFFPYHPCCQSTSVYRPKSNIPTRRNRKNCNFPHFFKFKKIHFSIMLICVICVQNSLIL